LENQIKQQLNTILELQQSVQRLHSQLEEKTEMHKKLHSQLAVKESELKQLAERLAKKDLEVLSSLFFLAQILSSFKT
jgi:hypothetical protein